jgi:inosine-uridine nucleoside N-ribohydrolase
MKTFLLKLTFVYQMTHRIWIDTDCGVDDAFAIIYALNNPDVSVEGISTVAGNVPEHQAYLNVQYILNAFNKNNVPIIRGSSHPISGELITCENVHGISGLGWINPKPTLINSTSFDLEDALARTSAEKIVSLGPLTNIAKFINSINQNNNIKAIHSMCGTLNQPNFFSGEYNLYVDSLAGDIILKELIKELYIYDTEFCEQFRFPTLLLNNNIENKKQMELVDLLMQWYDNRYLYDPLTMIGAVNQNLFKYKNTKLSSSTNRGMLTLDNEGKDAKLAESSINPISELSKFVLNDSNVRDNIVILSSRADALKYIGGLQIKYSQVTINVTDNFDIRFEPNASILTCVNNIHFGPSSLVYYFGDIKNKSDVFDRRFLMYITDYFMQKCKMLNEEKILYDDSSHYQLINQDQAHIYEILWRKSKNEF